MKLKLTKWAAEANNNCNLISRSGAITNNNNNNCSQVPTSLTTHTKGTWIRHPPAHLALASAAASLHAFKYTEEEKRVGAHLFQWLFKMVKNFFFKYSATSSSFKRVVVTGYQKLSHEHEFFFFFWRFNPLLFFRFWFFPYLFLHIHCLGL